MLQMPAVEDVGRGGTTRCFVCGGCWTNEHGSGLPVTDNVMLLAIGCMAIVAITYRVRRDITGPELTTMSNAASGVSLGALLVWVAADWLTGADDQWFTTLAGGLPLATIELGCLTVMTLDTFRQRARRASSGRHRAD